MKENGDLSNDENLKRLWYWLGNHETSTAEESNAENCHPGVRYVNATSQKANLPTGIILDTL